MGLFKTLSWALIFLTRLRFPPGSSIARIWSLTFTLFLSYDHILNDLKEIGLVDHNSLRVPSLI